MGTSAQPTQTLGRDLRSASDEQLSRVVAVIDAMPARGSADDLIAIVRPRLAALRPERPLTLSRILFSPLDPAIVDARAWRPATASIPRSALSVIGRDVMAAMGDLPAELSHEAAGASYTDQARLQQIGIRLWPIAAQAVELINQPKDWRPQTGLSEAMWLEIREAIGVVLSVAVRIEAAVAPHASEGELRALFAACRNRGERAFAVLVRVLLARHRDPDAVVRAVAGLGDKQVMRARELAIAGIIADTPLVLRTITDSSAALAGEGAVQLAAVLDAIESADGHNRTRPVRTKAIAACETRLARCLAEEVMQSLTSITAEVAPALAAAEKSARDACRLATALRMLGAPQVAQAQLRGLRDDLVGLHSEEVDAVDRARLAEILLGPDEAQRIERLIVARRSGG